LDPQSNSYVVELGDVKQTLLHTSARDDAAHRGCMTSEIIHSALYVV
jgi:hypothetical protein